MSLPSYQPDVLEQGDPDTYREHDDSCFVPIESRTPDQEIIATERAAVVVKSAARMTPPRLDRRGAWRVGDREPKRMNPSPARGLSGRAAWR